MKIVKSIFRISFLMMVFTGGFVLGCAGFGVQQDKELTDYVRDFSIEVNVPMEELEKIDVTFFTLKGKAPSGVIGRCFPLTKEIQIDPRYFYSEASEISRKSLIFHEIAHCQCGFGHTNELMKDGCANSLMHESDVPQYCLKKHWDHYMKDLQEICK